MSEHQHITRTVLPRGRSLWRDGLRRLGRRKLAVVCFVVVLFYFSLAGFIYLAEFFDWRVGPTLWQEQVGQSYSPPSSTNVFGTDIFGQSVLRKTLYGTNTFVELGGEYD